jgi:2-hydroxy-3-oxopropionate reductase
VHHRAGRGERADIIFTMVPDTPDVDKVLLGERGVAAASRVRPASGGGHELHRPHRHQAFARRIEALGADYVDAPVSGGEVGAKAASLTIMCGGSEAVFERVRPLLR